GILICASQYKADHIRCGLANSMLWTLAERLNEIAKALEPGLIVDTGPPLCGFVRSTYVSLCFDARISLIERDRISARTSAPLNGRASSTQTGNCSTCLSM